MTAAQGRQSPRSAGLEAKLVRRGGGQFRPLETRTQQLDGKRIPVLLRHHGDFIDTLLIAICEGEPISLAGRQAMAYTADRLREIAEVLE